MPRPLADVVAPDWAEALAPVADDVAAMGAYLREEIATGRRYLPDGSLVPRSRPDAFLEDPREAVRQVTWLIEQRGVRSICVHGDNPQAVQFVKELRAALTGQGIGLRAFA